jgi:uncharacterized membrane protein YfcA
MGVLLALLPLPAAMVLHAVTQIASNLWRGLLWRHHVRWTAALPYLIGSFMALGAWSLVRYVPGKPVALLMLGLTPFLMRMLPSGLKPDPERLPQGLLYGSASMILLLLTGVSGPLVDTFFLGGRLDRREVVAAKAVCQVFGHGAKLLYFASIVHDAAGVDPVLAALAVICSLIGTRLARRLLEAISDNQFRLWAKRLITAVSLYYVAQGTYLLTATVAD